ncbi:nuclear pore complex protein Nup107 [Trichonephila clavipes]|nr:nuclear pore complex protein Nup107 [Trichonephila clavipes]
MIHFVSFDFQGFSLALEGLRRNTSNFFWDIDWLEKNAEEDVQHTFFDKFQYFADKCMSLEHSLNELATTPFNQTQMGLHEMDPDAPFRQDGYPLHDADKENEGRLFKFMFMCLRAGKLDEAQHLAERFGEPWLSAALEGWRLFHDPNYDNEMIEGQELLPIEGNKYRDVWKVACWNASQAPVIPIYEQAIYGSLCGNLKAVLPVCKTWSDYLWAYTRASVDKLIEQELCNSSQQDRSLEELPFDYWDKILDMEEIFQELAASNSHEVRTESQNHHHILQKYVILDDLGGLIEEMYNWLNSSTLDGQILRCMTHIILFLRLIRQSTKEELCVPILEAYVQELIKSRRTYLVAPYCSTLPKEQQIIWYAKFLEGVTDNKERQKCLQYGEEAGLDMTQITKTVVKNIREKDSNKAAVVTDLTAATTEEDLSKIHAIDWLIFNPTQRAEALKQANALMRMFVVQRKMDAAKLLFSKIPQDSVAVMVQLAKAINIAKPWGSPTSYSALMPGSIILRLDDCASQGRLSSWKIPSPEGNKVYIIGWTWSAKISLYFYSPVINHSRIMISPAENQDTAAHIMTDPPLCFTVRRSQS